MKVSVLRRVSPEAAMIVAAVLTVASVLAVRGRLTDVVALLLGAGQRIDSTAFSMLGVVAAFYLWTRRPGNPGAAQRWGASRRWWGAGLALMGLPLWVGALVLSAFLLPHQSHLGSLDFHLANMVICIALYGAASLLVGIGSWTAWDRTGRRSGAGWSVWLWWTSALLIGAVTTLTSSGDDAPPPAVVWWPFVVGVTFLAVGGWVWAARRLAAAPSPAQAERTVGA